jgi:DNA-binding SARP family transcriptional activator/pimeloyl-ACP methyl ester carboxylesterase
MTQHQIGAVIQVRKGGTVRFGLLGSLEVRATDGREIEVRGRNLRTLLAVLLTNPNNAVSRERLIDTIWGSRPPSSARHGLDVLVARLRSALGTDCDGLVTRPGGYSLCLGPSDLDVGRFVASVAHARSAAEGDRLEEAVAALRGGLAEWRGPAYGELACAAFAVEEAMRLDELRCVALEELFELELQRSRHREIEPEIDGFVQANPLRERARAALMLALYRCGRQADALETYRAGAELLFEQGLEPGRGLACLQLAILRHDASLDDLANGSARLRRRPLTRYALNGEVALAYQVSGRGPFDVVYAPPFITHVELTWDVPTWAALLHRFGAFSRLIRFDKRGTGMSDRVGIAPIEVVAEDLRAVMDAAESTEAAVIGASDAGAIAVEFAALHPERVWALVLWGATPRVRWAPDYPCGAPDEELATDDERIWTDPGHAEATARALGAADVDELAAMWRRSASPGDVRALEDRANAVDVRALLADIRVPVLVLNRDADDRVAAGSDYLAAHIPGASHITFAGSEHVMFGASYDYEAIAGTIQRFLEQAWERRSEIRDQPAGPRPRACPKRRSATTRMPPRPDGSTLEPKRQPRRTRWDSQPTPSTVSPTDTSARCVAPRSR